MTDLISQLADAIVALNNASPRLPTKAEIEEVLRPYYKPRYLATRTGIAAEEIKAGDLVYVTRAEQSWRRLIAALNHTAYEGMTKDAYWAKYLNQCNCTTVECHCGLNKRSQLAADAKAHPAIFDQAKAYLADGPCPGSTDGSHLWYPATSRIPNGAFRCACGARKPA